MNPNKKNIVTIFLMAGLLVPFVLLTDIFPFMRFGMFAEPIKKEIQTEKFILYKTNTAHQKTVLDPQEIGINANTFYYLCRNYLYRKEAEVFSEKIFSAADSSIKEIEIYHLVLKKEALQPDTVYLGKYHRK